MTKYSTLIILLCLGLFTNGQAPKVQWQRCLGGTATDKILMDSATLSVVEKQLAVTFDSGYIVGGSTNSNDGDINGNHGNYDMWMIRLDQHGSTLWKKCLGGSANDWISSIQETSDHGYIIIGTTMSNDGDISGNHGNKDIWVARLDISGNIMWQKCFGGSNLDEGYSVKQTTDGGYVIAGLTQSNNGDVSGLHHSSNDSTDVWIVKLNSTGGIVWQKCLGGFGLEAGVCVSLTADGGYIIGTESDSNDGDVSGNHGGTDIWLVKLDASGNLTWQRCYGGTFTEWIGHVEQTPDNGFIFAGTTLSNNGDVSGNHSIGFDAWAVKTDASGNIVWQKCYGNISGQQGFSDVEQLPNGEFLFCGEHYGGAGEDVSIILGGSDIWIVKTSGSSAILWEKCVGGNFIEVGASLVKSGGDGYFLLGQTMSGNSFDVYGNHNPATYDIWIAKLGSVNTVTGIAYDDRNKNGVKDPAEVQVSGAIVKTAKPGYERSSVTVNGLFINSVDTGNFTTTINYSPYYISVPSSRNTNFTTYNNKDSFSFALQPIAGQRDLNLSAILLDPARPGFPLRYRLFYRNAGTDTVASGQVLFKRDSRINFISANPPISSSNGDTLKWNYSSLKPFDTASIIMYMLVQPPPAVNINDTLVSRGIITPIAGDLTPSDDTVVIRQRVVGSYDPNDKIENGAGLISMQQVLSGTFINYLIRFQNTGTDTALKVTIRDTLDTKLDWNSFEMIGTSHPNQLQVNSQNRLTWTFNNINLPDSGHNEPASHGFIAYRIKPKTNLVVGDIIKNAASIYFDYNLPVQTNIQETVVVNNIVTGTGSPQADPLSLSLFPNPTGEIIWLKLKDRANGNAVLTVIDVSGREVHRRNLGNINTTAYTTSLDLARYPPGMYTILLSVGKKLYSQKLVLQ